MKLILIRGLPGSGKSTLAELLVRAMPGLAWYEADMYFTDEHGKYHYNKIALPSAHTWCLTATRASMHNGVGAVVSNTFSRQWEIQPYFDLAKEFGITPSIIECQSNFGNIHGAPDDAIERMRARWEHVSFN